MRRPQANYSLGFTLTEVMITAAIIGVVFMASTTIIRIMNNASKEKVLVESQRDVEVLLYQMVRDVRDAARIVEISTNTPKHVTLSVYNVRGGYDVNTNPFWLTNNLLTLTYTYGSDSTGTYIERKITNAGGAVLERRKFLPNLVQPDAPSTPDEHVFQPVPFQDLFTGTYDTVQFELRIHPKNNPIRIYKVQAMTRAAPKS
jgi:prepilin-type N-terminal cleavage/methylation domain-containing protein